MIRRLLMGAAAALAVALAPTASAAPVVALQDDALPTIADPVSREARLDALAATGVRFTRLDILWNEVAPTRPADPRNPADPAYDWRRYDAVIRGLAARGIATIVDYYRTPAWASRRPKPAPADTPRVADAAAFAGAIASRYSGGFQPAGDATTLPEVRRIEVWNEPNIDVFYADQCHPARSVFAFDSARGYSALLAAAYREIKRSNPRAIVVGGVAGPTAGTSCPGQDPSAKNQAFVDLVVRERPPMDAWSQHLYPIGSPSRAYFFPSWRSIPRIARALDRLRPGIPIYVTETGYHTSYNRFHRYFVSEAQQAAWVDETFAQAARYPRVELATWFNLQDNPFWTGGLLRQDGTRKPSYDRFTAVARAAGAPPASWTVPPSR